MIKAESRAYFAALGAFITKLRKEIGMTQAELARAIGVSQQAVFAYELGERRVSVLILSKLAKIFGLSTDQLISRDRSAVVIKPSNGRLSPRAARHAWRLMALTKTQQRFVIRIIDTLEEGNARERTARRRKPLSSGHGWRAAA